MRVTSIGRDRIRHQLSAMFAGVALVLMQASVLADDVDLSDQNQRYLDDITALGITHGVLTVAGIVTPPPADKIPELQEYGLNIGMKFMPPVLEAPPTLVLRPEDGACKVTYEKSDHPLNPVIDYDNMYGINITKPSDWGWLDNSESDADSDDEQPAFYHYNTGAWLTIRRNFVELDGTSSPDRRILFADSNDRNEVTDELATELIEEDFNIGTSVLYWEAENKLDGLFDVLLDPVIFLAELKHAAKQKAAVKQAKRYGRVWDDAAIKWAKSLEFSLGREITQSVVKKLAVFGVELGANAAGSDQLTSIPTGVFNRQTQLVRVLDEVAPTITVTQQPEPFEATTLGGEIGYRHFDELRALLETSDNCDRPVVLNSGPTGTPFWPVGKTTTIQWCGRDLGPTSATGGFNTACADLFITVEDTLPPLIVPPPALNLVTSTSQSLPLGRPGVFDVADPDVVVTNDAPASFPVGRTPVTWTAMDSSGNSSTATQWVSLKESNAPPVAMAPALVDAVSFEEVRVPLLASDDDVLDGRHDQLAFRISDTPDNGFFKAPLFPFFIEDHRTHQINPDGTYSSFSNDWRLRCEGGELSSGDEIPIDVIVNPQYIAVDDAGAVVVLDQYFDCSPGSRTFFNFWRFAKFAPNADGELEFVNQYHLNNSPSDNERHIFIDHERRLWFVPFNGGNAIVVLDENLDEAMRIPFTMLTEINPVTGNEQAAFQNAPNQRVQSMVVDRNNVLYASSGSKMLAYDLETVLPADAEYSAEHHRRLARVFAYPSPDESESDEPYRSYLSLTGGGYQSLAIDSSGDVYVSDGPTRKVWKFKGIRLGDDREEILEEPELVGWLGRCDANLDPTVLACDTEREVSIGFACQDDLCGTSTVAGSGQGQFDNNRGIAMSPDDVLYVTDTGNYRVQRFTTDGYFAGEAVSECSGGCFVLGDFGYVTDVTVNSNFFYLLDRDQSLTHIFETTPITDVDDQTMEQQQEAFVTYQSKNNFVGTDTFSFFANDGLEDSNEAQVSINVTRNYRAPIATPGLEFETDEDTPLALALSGLDPDDDELSFAIVTAPEHGRIVENNGVHTYEPDPHYFGTDAFEFVASDAPSSSPAFESEPESVALTINPVNDIPVVDLEPEFTAGTGYEFKVELNLTDHDPDDRRRVAVHWGDSINSVPSDSESIVTSNASGTTRVVAQHIYRSPGVFPLTVCASDLPSEEPLVCESSEVTAIGNAVVNVIPMVDLVMMAEDSLPKTEDPVIEGLMLSDPLLDGGDEVTYTLTIINAPPESGAGLPATDIDVTVALPPEMEYLGASTSGGTCTDQLGQVLCEYATIVPEDSRQIDVRMRGAGLLLADEIVTLNAEVALAETDPGEEDNVASIQTTLLYNEDLDADGDGVANRDDAFPGDIAEWLDTDSDGIGNNADLDDDGDGMADGWEMRFALDPLVADADEDNDADGLTNGEEYERGSRPDTADSDADTVADGEDNCAGRWNRRQFDPGSDGTGDVCDASERASAVAFGDLNASGSDDAAILAYSAGMPVVFVKDGETDLSIATIGTGAADPLDLLGSDSIDGAGQAGVVVVDGAEGNPTARVFNPASGDAINSYEVLAEGGRIIDAILAGDDGPRLAALSRLSGGDIAVVSRDAVTGDAPVVSGYFDRNVEPIALASTDAGLAVLAAGTDGQLLVEVRAAGSGALVAEATVGGADWLHATIEGDGSHIVVTVLDLALQNNAIVVDASSGAVEGSFQVAPSGDALIGTGLLGESLAVVTADAAGVISMRYYDVGDGSELGASATFADGRSPHGWILSGDDFDAAIAAVVTSNANGEAFLERTTASDASVLPELTAAANTPPPPPPPPPVDNGNNSGGGGGGGSTSWLLIGTLILALRRRVAIPGNSPRLARGPARP